MPLKYSFDIKIRNFNKMTFSSKSNLFLVSFHWRDNEKITDFHNIIKLINQTILKRNFSDKLKTFW